MRAKVFEPLRKELAVGGEIEIALARDGRDGEMIPRADAFGDVLPRALLYEEHRAVGNVEVVEEESDIFGLGHRLR